MTSLKTGYLLFLAAFLFLSTVPTVAEVVNSVAECNQYLLQDTPPEIPGILKDGDILDQNRYKPICQTYNNQRRFLTLYDITNKIPVFSAYKYVGIKDTGRPRNDWKIEPQIFFTVPTVAEVVKYVTDCKPFLLQDTPPEIPGILKDGDILDQNRYKPICQTYNNQRRFLTLYDIKNKIPVFSAYKYVGITEERRPLNYWKIEPQLEGKTDKNMEDEDTRTTYTNQASSTDYVNRKNYDKGHLYPSTHGSTYDDKESTMTLTNIVPQADRFNQGRWNKMEDCVKCVMDTFCKDNNEKIEGFVVTGAQPGTEQLNNKVNIPSIVWSAFCCYNPKKKMWIASAHWDNNVREGPDYLHSQTLADLHNTLGGANLFPGTQCPLDKKLGDYKRIKITQTCSKCK